MTSTGKYITGIEMSRNMFGILKAPMREALYNYYEFPNADNWNDIYAIVISSRGRISTVWQAVLAVDPSFPNRIPADAWDTENESARWTRVPSRELFVEALNIALKQNIDKVIVN